MFDTNIVNFTSLFPAYRINLPEGITSYFLGYKYMNGIWGLVNRNRLEIDPIVK